MSRGQGAHCRWYHGHRARGPPFPTPLFQGERKRPEKGIVTKPRGAPPRREGNGGRERQGCSSPRHPREVEASPTEGGREGKAEGGERREEGKGREAEREREEERQRGRERGEREAEREREREREGWGERD